MRPIKTQTRILRPSSLLAVIPVTRCTFFAPFCALSPASQNHIKQKRTGGSGWVPGWGPHQQRQRRSQWELGGFPIETIGREDLIWDKSAEKTPPKRRKTKTMSAQSLCDRNEVDLPRESNLKAWWRKTVLGAMAQGHSLRRGAFTWKQLQIETVPCQPGSEVKRSLVTAAMYRHRVPDLAPSEPPGDCLVFMRSLT